MSAPFNVEVNSTHANAVVEVLTATGTTYLSG
jgi:hypothetical protein